MNSIQGLDHHSFAHSLPGTSKTGSSGMLENDDTFAALLPAVSSDQAGGSKEGSNKSETRSDGSLTSSTSNPERSMSAAEEFRKYMEMSPAEKIRHHVLQELGLTEEEFDALPPEEQQRIAEIIVEKLQEAAKVQAQTIVDPQGRVDKALALFETTQVNDKPRSTFNIFS